MARLPEDDRPEPESDVDHVTSTAVGIDPVPYRFAPGEVAFAVRASGEFSSTSTDASWERLYLFRRRAGRLSMIFNAETATSELDKASAKPADTHRWIVRFGVAPHGGAYDLILAPAHSESSRRFTWSGSDYRPADAPAVRPH